MRTRTRRSISFCLLPGKAEAESVQCLANFALLLQALTWESFPLVSGQVHFFKP